MEFLLQAMAKGIQAYMKPIQDHVTSLERRQEEERVAREEAEAARRSEQEREAAEKLQQEQTASKDPLASFLLNAIKCVLAIDMPPLLVRCLIVCSPVSVLGAAPTQSATSSTALPIHQPLVPDLIQPTSLTPQTTTAAFFAAQANLRQSLVLSTTTTNNPLSLSLSHTHTHTHTQPHNIAAHLLW
jgi:hypothetical protein